MVVLVVQSAVVSIRSRRPTIRSTRPATAAIFNLGLLAEAVLGEAHLAHPQAAELMAVRHGIILYFLKRRKGGKTQYLALTPYVIRAIFPRNETGKLIWLNE